MKFCWWKKSSKKQLCYDMQEGSNYKGSKLLIAREARILIYFCLILK